MIGNLAKWGNSLALRIPAPVMRALDVREGTAVELAVIDGALLVRPAAGPHHFDLDALLAGMTDENRHGEMGSGSSRGNEL